MRSSVPHAKEKKEKKERKNSVMNESGKTTIKIKESGKTSAASECAMLGLANF